TSTPTSRATYVASFTAFVTWAFSNKPHLIDERFRATIDADNDDDLRKELKSKLDRNREKPPLHFELLESSDFVMWLLTLGKRDGTHPGFSSYGNHRAALSNLYRLYGVLMLPKLTQDLTTDFKDLKRQLASNAAHGTVKITTERFRKQLTKLLSKPTVAEELNRRGIHAEDIGTHSLRKRSSTYCSSGSTACPSSIAVHLRAGWTLGHGQNTYQRYEAAGDMHVGRTVCGLPLDSPGFALLPPHFIARDQHLSDTMSRVFGKLPDGISFIAEHTLASMVFHSDFVKSHVHPDHRVLPSPLFQVPGLIAELRLKLSRSSSSNDSMTATRIPPNVAILGHIQGIRASVDQTVAVIKSAQVTIVDDVVGRLNNGNQVLTRDTVESAVTSAIDRCGVRELVEDLRNERESQSLSPPTDPPAAPQQTVFLWGGGFHILPGDFAWPNCCPRGLWVLWLCGDVQHGWPALNRAKSKDFASKSARKRMSAPNICVARFLPRQSGKESRSAVVHR
ncbi:TPA: hypothetical protein N0F65_000414, partial [Lagenidium giganteum]